MFCLLNQKDIVENQGIGRILVGVAQVVKRKEINNVAPLRHEVMTLSGGSLDYLFSKSFLFVVPKDVMKELLMWTTLPPCLMADQDLKKKIADLFVTDITRSVLVGIK
jgi:hypothetical protein